MTIGCLVKSSDMRAASLSWLHDSVLGKSHEFTGRGANLHHFGPQDPFLGASLAPDDQ
jgi:hypothetical protein